MSKTAATPIRFATAPAASGIGFTAIGFTPRYSYMYTTIGFTSAIGSKATPTAGYTTASMARGTASYATCYTAACSTCSFTSACSTAVAATCFSAAHVACSAPANTTGSTAACTVRTIHYN